MDLRRTGREEDSIYGDNAEGIGAAEEVKPICFFFLANNEYRDHVRRQANIRDGKPFGTTAGDSFWIGYGDYYEVDQFAKYRDEEPSKPITVPAWRARIDKAKRDIEKHKSEQRVQLLAESISDDQILREIEVIRTWARSLQQTQSQTGLRELTKAGTN